MIFCFPGQTVGRGRPPPFERRSLPGAHPGGIRGGVPQTRPQDDHRPQNHWVGRAGGRRHLRPLQKEPEALRQRYDLILSPRPALRHQTQRPQNRLLHGLEAGKCYLCQ